MSGRTARASVAVLPGPSHGAVRLVCGAHGQRRHVAADDPLDALFAIGCAFLFADATARPGFREMIDTIRWEDVR